MGGRLLGWRTACAVEFDAYARSVLLQRQADGLLERFPIWDDVRTFDGRPWRGRIDVVSGGFPCTDISNSGHKVGITGERSGLWTEMARIICEVGPRFVFVENVASLLDRGMGDVLGALASMGFDARWGVLGSADTGGAQIRERTWIVADAQGIGRRTIHEEFSLLRAAKEHCTGPACSGGAEYAADSRWILREAEPGVDRVADGMADRVDRIRCHGNGQDPRTAAAAWRILTHND